MAMFSPLIALACGRAKIELPTKKAHLIHKGEHFFHGSYLAGVSIEGHGFYRYLAMIALVFVLMAAIIKEVES